ncbi:MAG TPA: hypothetical protein VFP84_10465 [Kofleriaceae bacterium]|nr:hypothetical protein [Kofleriaceae bacterium]
MFHRELLEAIHLLETTRSPGSPWPMKGYPDGKRILLRKSQCHLYFDVNERSARIEILEIWDARRRRPPKL